jgi:hypothetical protein
VTRSIETETPPTQVNTKDYESAYNALIQTHLPQLEDRDLIEYDEERKTIVVTHRVKKYALILSMTRFLIAFPRTEN